MSLPSMLSLSDEQPPVAEVDGVPDGDSHFLLREKRLNWQAKKAISFDLEKNKDHISDNCKGIS